MMSMPFYSRLQAIGLAGLGRLAFAVVIVILESIARLLLIFVPTNVVHLLRLKLTSLFPRNMSRTALLTMQGGRGGMRQSM